MKKRIGKRSKVNIFIIIIPVVYDTRRERERYCQYLEDLKQGNKLNIIAIKKLNVNLRNFLV